MLADCPPIPTSVVEKPIDSCRSFWACKHKHMRKRSQTTCALSQTFFHAIVHAGAHRSGGTVGGHGRPHTCQRRQFWHHPSPTTYSNGGGLLEAILDLLVIVCSSASAPSATSATSPTAAAPSSSSPPSPGAYAGADPSTNADQLS